MARMLGRSGTTGYFHCCGMKCKYGRGTGLAAAEGRRTMRQREKRVTQKWLDEYENREPIFCPWNYLNDPDEVGFTACNC